MRIANIQNGGSCPNGWKQILSPVKACRANGDAATDAILHFLVATNFPISTSVVKWLGIKKALQMDTEHLITLLIRLKL